jgi:glycine/serine hydroxymethyltransferase
VTTQGMVEADMATIAGLIQRVLVGRDDDAELAAVRDEVIALCSKLAPYPRG